MTQARKHRELAFMKVLDPAYYNHELIKQSWKLEALISYWPIIVFCAIAASTTGVIFYTGINKLQWRYIFSTPDLIAPLPFSLTSLFTGTMAGAILPIIVSLIYTLRNVNKEAYYYDFSKKFVRNLKTILSILTFLSIVAFTLCFMERHNWIAYIYNIINDNIDGVENYGTYISYYKNFIPTKMEAIFFIIICASVALNDCSSKVTGSIDFSANFIVILIWFTIGMAYASYSHFVLTTPQVASVYMSGENVCHKRDTAQPFNSDGQATILWSGTNALILECHPAATEKQPAQRLVLYHGENIEIIPVKK